MIWQLYYPVFCSSARPIPSAPMRSNCEVYREARSPSFFNSRLESSCSSLLGRLDLLQLLPVHVQLVSDRSRSDMEVA